MKLLASSGRSFPPMWGETLPELTLSLTLTHTTNKISTAQRIHDVPKQHDLFDAWRRDVTFLWYKIGTISWQYRKTSQLIMHDFYRRKLWSMHQRTLKHHRKRLLRQVVEDEKMFGLPMQNLTWQYWGQSKKRRTPGWYCMPNIGTARHTRSDPIARLCQWDADIRGVDVCRNCQEGKVHVYPYHESDEETFQKPVTYTENFPWIHDIMRQTGIHLRSHQTFCIEANKRSSQHIAINWSVLEGRN